MLLDRHLLVYFGLWITCLFGWVRAMDQKCPEPVDIQPCLCGSNQNPPPIICENISSLAVLQEVFDRSDVPFLEFRLYESDLMYLPSRALNQKNIQKMRIWFSTLITLFDRQPEENHKLFFLEWIGSKLLRGILWEQLRSLRNLRILQVERTLVNEVRVEFEESISPTLERFILSDSHTKAFSPTLFQKLVNLRDVEILHTRLSMLNRSMFPEKNKIEVLNFSYNLIKSLPDDVFSNMPNIQKLDLEGNQLKTFSEAVFGHIMDSAILGVFMQENPISCDCSFKWVLYKDTPVKVNGRCNNPISRKGKDFKELRREDFSYCLNSLQTLLETSI